jgi:pimeloyl-ACP methyl ester carboxylesterase
MTHGDDAGAGTAGADTARAGAGTAGAGDAYAAAGVPGVGSRHLVAAGVRCHYLEAGAAHGAPLLLLHGTAIDAAALSYGPSLPALGAHRRTVALDWPGYGASERPATPLSAEDHVALVGAFLDALGAHRAHLAGFSMGGAAALGFALRAPERVASLTLVGSYGLDRSLPLPLLPYLALRAPALEGGVVWALRRSRHLTRLVLARIVFADPRSATPPLVAAVQRQLRAPEAERSFVAWLRGELRPFALATSFAERLADLRVPTLLLHGRADRVVPWRKAARAHARLPGSRLVVLPRCGHWLMREAPDAFRSELLAFVAAHAEG